MKRRPYQVNDSTFRVECHASGWRVTETWQEIDRRGEKDDCDESYGSFPTREEAHAEKARLEGL